MMDEQKEKENVKEEKEIPKDEKQDEGSDNVGDVPEDKRDFEIVREAKEAAMVIRDENDRREKLIEREEKLQDRKEAFKALGGGSLAGSKGEKKEEESNVDYAKRALSGQVKP